VLEVIRLLRTRHERPPPSSIMNSRYAINALSSDPSSRKVAGQMIA
jgi:hypothetical protein